MDPKKLSVTELQNEIIKNINYLRSPDANKRNQAKDEMILLGKSPYYFYALTELYAIDPKKNMIIGVILRNDLTATDPTVRKRIEENFYNSKKIDEIRKKLSECNDEISNHCLAQIGSMQIRRNEWPNFFSECSLKVLFLTIENLKTYRFDFENYQEKILVRMTDPDSLINIIDIFTDSLDHQKLNFLIQHCLTTKNVANLTKILFHYHRQIENKEILVEFVSNNLQNELDVIKFFEVLKSAKYSFDPHILYNFLKSDDSKIIYFTEKLLCDLMDSIFSNKSSYDKNFIQRTKHNADIFLRENMDNYSFIRVIYCCPIMFKSDYLEFLLNAKAFCAFRRIAEFDFNQIVIHLPKIITATLSEIENNKSPQACSLIQTIADQTMDGQPENELSFCFIEILNTLILASEKVKYTEYEKRSAIFCALNALIKKCCPNMQSGLEKLLFYLMSKVKESLKIIHTLNDNDFLILEDILTWYITVIEEILNCEQESAHIEDVYRLFLEILKSRRITSLVGDVYISLSSLIYKYSFFLGKMEELIGFIDRDMKFRRNMDIYTFKAAHLLIGDIAQILSKGLLKYGFLTENVLENLASNFVPKTIKPILLSILSDLIYAMGNSYKHKDLTLDMLKDIFSIDRNSDILFVDYLRKNAILLLNTMIMSFSDEIDKNLCITFISKTFNEDEDWHCLDELINISRDFILVYDDCSYPVLHNIYNLGLKYEVDNTEKLGKLINQQY